MVELLMFVLLLFMALAVTSGVVNDTWYTHRASDFCTWWHANGEVADPWTRVQPGNVRQSHRYHVQVSIADAGDYHDSFVYESIPRNGNGRIYSPWDAPDSNTFQGDDGITIEAVIGVTMGWTQILYSQDIDVKIERMDGSALPFSRAIIRPTSTKYSLRSSGNGGIVIRVPWYPNGRKFSVEFEDDLFTYRSDGSKYVLSGGTVVGREPTNALLIFASNFLPGDMIPSMNDENTMTMTPGPINNGDWGSAEILYFPPGIYWMSQAASGAKPKYGENHMRLHPNTYWVYFAPGAYVKGAIQYSTQQDFYATGHGVLSGEHYVYQANPTTFYQAVKSDGDSLRMWSHSGLSGGQTWHCLGPTISSPPFNTMDFHGDEQRISVRISDYKQVGAFFFQTDGPQMYPNSQVHDVFYHVNDDAIKVYYSGVSVSQVIVWKCHNDPVIQMGWSDRDVHDVKVDTLEVIHTRYMKPEMYVPSSIIGASPSYSSGSANTSKSVSIAISNILCEGPCPALMRISPLQNYKLVVQNISMPDGLLGAFGIGDSIIPASPGIVMNLDICNWYVAEHKITMSNFQSDSWGRFNINVQYWGEWRIRSCPLEDTQWV